MQHWIKTIYKGDELLLYDASRKNEIKSFPARVRVMREAAGLPRLVNRDGGPGEGRRWPYVTYVKVLGAVDHSVAPTPRNLEIAMSQGGHRRLGEATYNLAASYIPDGFAGPRLSKSL